MARSEQQLLTKTSQQMNAGKFAAAVKTAQIGFKSFPKSSAFPSAAGLAFAQLGQHRKAAEFFARALSVAPNNAETQDNLVQALVLSGNTDKALSLSERFLSQMPQRDAQHYLRAMAYLQVGRPDLAVQDAQLAFDMDPKSVRNRKMLAEALSSSGRFDEAATQYEALAGLQPHEPQFIVEHANMHVRNRDIPKAKAVVENALSDFPNAIDLIEHLANLHVMTGDRASARAGYKKLLDIDPVFAPAWMGLAGVSDKEDATGVQSSIASCLEQIDRKSHGAALMRFALAGLAEKLGDVPAEIEALEQANRIEAHRRPYDRSGADLQFKTLQAANLLANGTPLHVRPIFIVGLPRSGTSLLERMIGAHPDVMELGEFEGGARVMNALQHAEPGSVTSEALAELYLSGLNRESDGPANFTDKLPANYKILRQLMMIFPAARFVHLTRAPADTALSTWRNYFADTAMDYAFDFDAMAHEFNLYQRFIRDAHDAANGCVLDIRYEDLVAEPEQTTRAIAEFCQLDWAEAMVQPERSTSAILTASALQARQKVHTRSIGMSADFAAILEPFLAKLDPNLWDQTAI